VGGWVGQRETEIERETGKDREREKERKKNKERQGQKEREKEREERQRVCEHAVKAVGESEGERRREAETGGKREGLCVYAVTC